MLKAPISWGPIIVLDNIVGLSTLYTKVTQHEVALLQAAKMEALNIITADNLQSWLKKIGFDGGQRPSFV